MLPLGEQLKELCKQGQQEITLVAPFIKAHSLYRLLESIRDSINLICVTRWYPDEILNGVSDLEIWTVLKQRQNSSLWLRSDRHAKFYRIDSTCFVGSANITNAALGWSYRPNLELLVQLSADNQTLEQFEKEVMRGGIQVDESIYCQMLNIVEKLRDKIPQAPHSIEPDQNIPLPEKRLIIHKWIPSLRRPEDLYLIYSNQDKELTHASRLAGIQDIQFFPINDKGLSEEAFRQWVGMFLLQLPIIRAVDSFVATPQRFGSVRDFLLSLPCVESPDFNASQAWQKLMRWLLYFLPERYTLSVPNYTEVFCRVA